MKKIIFLLFLAFITPASAAIPENGQIKFQVLRNGNPFGVHTLNFSETNDGHTKVDIHIKMSVSAGPISFFKYEHFNTEVWNGKTLLSLSTETNDNGDEYFVNANWDGSQFELQSSSQNRIFEDPLVPTSYWHPSFIQANQKLNTQKGTIDEIAIQSVADDIVNGRPATKYIVRVNDERNITVWYDKETNQWVGLDFIIRGQNISYNRITDF